MDAFDRVVALMDRLRSPGGCPWDAEQTHASLRRYVIEEAYEVADAIDKADAAGLAEELGDLLLQVVFHARVGQETGAFDIDAICEGLAGKLVRRHPHVFEEQKALDAAEVVVAWEARKRRERGPSASVLDGLPRALPAMLRAWRLGDRAAAVGFDWTATLDVLAKLDEEREEFAEALAIGEKERIQHELGDLLLTVVNLARKLDTDPETALREATDRFEDRFRAMETGARDEGAHLEDLTPAELDSRWNKAKASLEGRASNR